MLWLWLQGFDPGQETYQAPPDSLDERSKLRVRDAHIPAAPRPAAVGPASPRSGGLTAGCARVCQYVWCNAQFLRVGSRPPAAPARAAAAR